jgi:hypothetical protein
LIASLRRDFKSPEKRGKDQPAAKLFKLLPSITISANAQGGYSKEAGRKITFEDLKSFVKEQNYNENIESILRATEHQQYGNNVAKDKNLSSALSATLEKLQSHRDSYQLHQQKAERLSRGAQLMQSSSFDSRTNLTQAVLEFIADQQSSNGKSVVGMDTARKILEASSGPLAERKEQYIQAFQAQRAKNIIHQFVSEHIKGPTSLEAEFKAKKEMLNKSGLEAQHANNLNELIEKAKKENLDFNTPINPEIKNEVEEMNAQKQELLKNSSAILNEKYQKMAQEKKEAGDKNLLVNLFRSIGKHNKEEED